MIKSKILLKVAVCDNEPEWEGASLNVSVWENEDPESDIMNGYATSCFPELIQLGLKEVSECDMLYYGDLTVELMINKLKELGFNSELLILQEPDIKYKLPLSNE